jgi:hypothetical protein
MLESADKEKKKKKKVLSWDKIEQPGTISKSGFGFVGFGFVGSGSGFGIVG